MVGTEIVLLPPIRWQGVCGFIHRLEGGIFQ